MERLTQWNDKTEGAELISWNEEEWKDFMGSLDVPICTELSIAIDKLAEYEDIEEKITKKFAGCIDIKTILDSFCAFYDMQETKEELAQCTLLTNEDVLKYRQWKDAEEQGLLLRLPVPEGTKVWVLDYIFECKHGYNCVLEFDNYKCEANIPCRHEYKVCRVKETAFNHTMLGTIGKTVFLTKEEAEQALARMEKENGKVN